MDQLAHFPWYVKILLACGGATFAWKLIQGRIPLLFEWVTPIALKVVDTAMAAALIHPVVRWFIFGNKANVEALLTAVCDGLEGLIDKIEKRMIVNIEAEAAKDATKPAV